MNNKSLYLLTLISLIFLHGCYNENNSSNKINEPKNPFGTNPIECETKVDGEINWTAIYNFNCNKLSEYGLFKSIKNNVYTTHEDITPYHLNNTLFTDFTRKYRFILLPTGKKIDYIETDTFNFPIGSTLIKIFALPEDVQKEPENILEVRLLIKRENGWEFLPFVWYPELSDAYLSVTGTIKEHTIISNNLPYTFDYRTPSKGQCSVCHVTKINDKTFLTPIGPKARNLNYLDPNSHVNQLQYWSSIGILTALPEDLSSIEFAPNWQDQTATLEDRAKAYLDINCAHCHSDGGSGELSGLRLEYWRKDIDYKHGICNPSHGWRGGGFDIWPGRGEISSIPIRMRHTEPKDRMPPIGRSLVDEEAAQLISDWIDTLPYESCAE